MKILIEALETGKLTNEINKETFKLLGEALSSRKLTDKEYPKTLKLFGDAILNGLITDDKHKETLTFLAEVLKHREASDEIAFKHLTKMLKRKRRCRLGFKKKSKYKIVKNKEAILPVDDTRIIAGTSISDQYGNYNPLIKGEKFKMPKSESFCENRKNKNYIGNRSKVNSDTLQHKSPQNHTILYFTISRRLI
ncbi:hypothetical protein NBO_170g0001 [Nosema bombycis CQ1]|uniref:Uncharacterized protein n=1 Tax=Nosema bombycis (strain CQ1 / CVCC 102059) TaxID=578461 RepID=R0MG59_NOSB1|nr:hypothetical protein NBO_170g0001 [Nosema bombycis CQ1]|eukprot:EOB13120.1 hypothetical protein NBO_170g0001 [Nosema bombycis CQ1]